MKNYSLRALTLTLFYTLVISTSLHGSITPQPTPITNATWGKALKESAKEEYSKALTWLKFFKLPSLALSYALPTWGITKFWNILGDTEHMVTGLAVGYALTAVSLRYKNQIIETCGDEETAQAWMAIVPFAGFFLPRKVACLAGLAVIAKLHKKEWSDLRKIHLKPIN